MDRSIAEAPVAAPGRLTAGFASIAGWPARRWVVAVAAAACAALLTGVPTGIVQTTFYTRMTPVTWWDYPVWAISSVLVGLTAATYIRGRSNVVSTAPDQKPRTVGYTVLSVFAVGCPICNKLVVALLGVSGALTYFAPIQPIIGVATIALLATGLAVRLRGAVACTMPSRP